MSVNTMTRVLKVQPGAALAAARPMIEPELGRRELVETIVAALRYHPHVNNVLTHVSSGQWPRVDQALSVIFDRQTTAVDLSPLARNLVDLLCAERGVTGRILKPYFRHVLARLLPGEAGQSLWNHIAGLSLEIRKPVQGGVAVTRSTDGGQR